jgi:hypothetical protein
MCLISFSHFTKRMEAAIESGNQESTTYCIGCKHIIQSTSNSSMHKGFTTEVMHTENIQFIKENLKMNTLFENINRFYIQAPFNEYLHTEYCQCPTNDVNKPRDVMNVERWTNVNDKICFITLKVNDTYYSAGTKKKKLFLDQMLRDELKWDDNLGTGKTFILQGFSIYHQGSVGHWTTFVPDQNLNTFAHFNDLRVHLVSKDDALNTMEKHESILMFVHPDDFEGCNTSHYAKKSVRKTTTTDSSVGQEITDLRAGDEITNYVDKTLVEDFAVVDDNDIKKLYVGLTDVKITDIQRLCLGQKKSEDMMLSDELQWQL